MKKEQQRACAFRRFGVFIECASDSVPKPETLIRFAGIIRKMGYNTLYLGTADTYEIAGEPYFGYMRGRYTAEEIRRVDAACKELGVELVPAIQTLAHLHFLPNYEDYRELFDTPGILMADDDRVYALIDKMFRTMSENFTSRTIHIGMDEAFLLGVGRHLEKYGYESRMNIMTRHLARVLEIADRYGFTCEMWSDMFFRLASGGAYDAKGSSAPEEISVPQNVKLVYWNYSLTDRAHCGEFIEKHLALTPNVGYAGGLWKWIGFAPANRFSNYIGDAPIEVCAEKGIDSFILTLWADNGGEASLFSILPSLFYYSERAHGKSAPNKERFFELTGVAYDDFVGLDLLNYPQEQTFRTLNNKSYFYLYNDALLGPFDSMLSDGIGEAYAGVAEELNAVNGGEYQYLFDTLTSLARVLSVKAELGKRLYAAYRAENRDGLRRIAEEDIPRLVRDLDEFFRRFERQWRAENKSFGFEVHCQRLGGLRQRLLYVKSLVGDYLAGTVEKIEEFEVAREKCGYDKRANEDDYILMTWSQMVTNGFI